MRIYHASLRLEVLERYFRMFDERLNVLLSIALIGADTRGFLIEKRKMAGRIIADSGAWSVAMGRSTFPIDALISYLRLWRRKFFLYFNFDTDFTTSGFANNLANQLKMESEGLTPVPVIHNFYNNEIRYYATSGKYSWLALGSSQCKKFEEFQRAVDKIKNFNSAIRIHWFGGSRFEWLVKTPIGSCDTTFWAKQGSVGCIYYWNEELNKAHRIYVGGRIKGGRGLYHFTQYEWGKQLEEYLWTTFHFEHKDLLGHNDIANMEIVNLRYLADMERRINAERKRQGIALE